MTKTMNIFVFFIFLGSISCVSESSKLTNEYYDLKSYAETEMQKTVQDKYYKIVNYKDKIVLSDTATISSDDQEMSDLFNVMKDYNLSLQNLTGAYKADTTTTTGGTTITYTPFKDNLKIKSLILNFSDERLVSIHGLKETSGIFSTYRDEFKYTHPFQFEISSLNEIIFQDPQEIKITTLKK